MRHIFKWLGSGEQARKLWENREALDKYMARLKELMEADEPPPQPDQYIAPDPGEPLPKR